MRGERVGHDKVDSAFFFCCFFFRGYTRGFQRTKHITSALSFDRVSSMHFSIVKPGSCEERTFPVGCGGGEWEGGKSGRGAGGKEGGTQPT